MDKQTLSNYGWIVVCVLVLAVMIAMATPFGSYVSIAIENTTEGLYETHKNAFKTIGINLKDNDMLPCKHDYELISTQEATCSDNGSKTFKCKNCESSYKEDILATGCINFTTYDDDKKCNDCGLIAYGAKQHAGIIYNNATYTKSNGTVYKTGDIFPNSENGDTYTYGDYMYHYGYGYCHNHNQWSDICSCNSKNTGWSVRVLNTTKKSYDEILLSINNIDITTLRGTFHNCTNLISAPAIPQTTISLNNAFMNCSSLSDISAISLPKTLTKMSYTFTNCASLTIAPNISNNINLSQMTETFSGCSSLKTYYGNTNADGDFSDYIIPNKCSNLNSTFKGCTLLTKAPTIPANSNTSSMFLNCTSLIDASNVIITKSGDVHYGTFFGCTSLEKAPTIQEGVTYTSGMFSGCKSLKTAPSLPNTIQNASWMFEGCKSLLKAPEIPSNAININGMFYKCENITNTPVIPDTVKYAASAFEYCWKLTNIPNIPSKIEEIRLFINHTNLSGTIQVPCTATDVKTDTTYPNTSTIYIKVYHTNTCSGTCQHS